MPLGYGQWDNQTYFLARLLLLETEFVLEASSFSSFIFSVASIMYKFVPSIVVCR